MSEVMSDNEQSSLLPEAAGLPVLQSGGEALPAVPGDLSCDDSQAAQRVCESAPHVRPDDDQADPSGTQSRVKFPWTDENTAEAVRLWKASKTGGEIALVLGTTRGSVIGRIRRLGLLGAPERVNLYASKWRPERDTELRRLATEGFSRAEIASQMGMTYDSVHGRLRRLGIRTRPRGKAKIRQPRNPRMVIPEADPPDRSKIIHILDTTAFDRRCRFPLWSDDERSEFLFCGHKVAHETTSYCAFHHHLCRDDSTKSERNAANISINATAPELVADIAAEATA